MRYNSTRLLQIFVAVLFIALCIMPILKAFNLHASYMDLGVFDHAFWELANDFSWQRLFFGHGQPLMVVFAGLYAIVSSMEVLVFVQAVLIASSLPLFVRFADFSTLKPVHLALVFLLFFPVWYNALFDFHMDHLVIPLGISFYYLCFRERWLLATICALSLALVKEPFALMTAFCGIYMCLRFRKMVPGSILVVFGVAYFYAITCMVIPQATWTGESFASSSAFSWLGDTPLEMLGHIFSNPFSVFKEVLFTPGKMIYLLALFGSLGFISLLSPWELIPALPILGISLLSQLSNYYALGHHYTAGLIAPLLVAFALGYPGFEKLMLRLMDRISGRIHWQPKIVLALILWMVLCHVMISPSPASRLFWTNKVWSYGFEAYMPSQRTMKIREAIEKHIPRDPSANLATQNTLLTGRLTHRKVSLLFPNGVLEKARYPAFDSRKGFAWARADYVLLDLKRPWYVKDKGCRVSSRYFQETDLEIPERIVHVSGLEQSRNLKWVGCTSVEFRKRFISILKQTLQSYDRIYSYDGFMILRRKKG